MLSDSSAKLQHQVYSADGYLLYMRTRAHTRSLTTGASLRLCRTLSTIRFTLRRRRPRRWSPLAWPWHASSATSGATSSFPNSGPQETRATKFLGVVCYPTHSLRCEAGLAGFLTAAILCKQLRLQSTRGPNTPMAVPHTGTLFNAHALGAWK